MCPVSVALVRAKHLACSNAAVHKRDHEPVVDVGGHGELFFELFPGARDSGEGCGNGIEHVNGTVIDYDEDIPKRLMNHTENVGGSSSAQSDKGSPQSLPERSIR